MSITYFYDWTSLTKAIEGEIPNILNEDVAPVAKEILKKHIKEDIYGAYTPKSGGRFGGVVFTSPYNRRETLMSSIYTLIISSNRIYQMLITSDATANTPILKNYSWVLKHPGSFLEMIEGRNRGLWKSGFPRPAVSNAQREISTSSSIKSAIENGITKKISG